MVSVASSFYIIPLEMVLECIELSEEDKGAANKRNYINLRGEVLPYVRIRELFNEDKQSSEIEHLVVVQYGGSRTGLVVDALFGEVQTVIKSLGKVYKDLKWVSGATILGDGTIALILDVPNLIKFVES